MAFSDEFISILEQVREFESKSIRKRVWYRGQGNSKYQLLSGLFREDVNGDLGNILANEQDYYVEFKSASNLHNQSGWELLTLMQHYGVRTRLLDWSKSFAVALYFAYTGCSQKESKTTIRVWLLDAYALNHLALDENLFSIPPISFLEESFTYEESFLDPQFLPCSFAFTPSSNSSRIIAQQGVFTVQGSTILPLNKEEFGGEPLSTSVLSYVDIHPEMANDVARFLQYSGINHFSVFPDLDGLARHIMNDLYPMKLIKYD